MPGTSDLVVTAPTSTSERWALATAKVSNSGAAPPEKPPPQVLNEMLARLGMGPANFEVIQATGMPNAMTFGVQLTLFGHVYTGTAKNKKSARTLAAEAAVADQEAWYKPNRRARGDENEGEHNVKGEEEEEEEEEEARREQEKDNLPVVDDRPGNAAGPKDRGQLPGSYPK